MLGVASCTARVPPPEKTIEMLYAPYLSHAAERGDFSWEKADVYSKNFKDAIDRAFQYSTLLNEPVIDGDPVAAAQDFSLSNLKIVVDRPANAGKAHVLASFDNLGRRTDVGYDMVLENGTWRINGIRDGDADFLKSIDDALKPVGEPNAMKTPVQEIYDRYSTSGEREPLFRWAAFTNELRAKLERAGGRSLFDSFDPICGGSCAAISNPRLEAVSGAVIARFRANNTERAVVFDVVQLEGNWLIQDIHSSGNPGWDLIEKLSAAGIR